MEPITSTVPFPISPMHCLIDADETTGLEVPSVALLNQIRTVDRRRLIKRIGALDSHTLAQVDEAIRVSLALAMIPETRRRKSRAAADRERPFPIQWLKRQRPDSIRIP